MKLKVKYVYTINYNDEFIEAFYTQSVTKLIIYYLRVHFKRLEDLNIKLLFFNRLNNLRHFRLDAIIGLQVIK